MSRQRTLERLLEHRRTETQQLMVSLNLARADERAAVSSEQELRRLSEQAVAQVLELSTHLATATEYQAIAEWGSTVAQRHARALAILRRARAELHRAQLQVNEAHKRELQIEKLLERMKTEARVSYARKAQRDDDELAQRMSRRRLGGT